MESAVETVRGVFAPVLREACLEDHPGIASLQARNGLTSRSYTDWSALWTSNPAFSGRSSAPVGWVLEDARGVIRGYVGNLPLEYRLRGKTIRAATPYSWVVDAGYRSHSVTLLHRFLKQPGVDLFVCTTPNEAAGSVMQALRFRRAPSGYWDRTGFWITGHLGFAQSILRTAPVRLPAMLAYPLGAALSVADALRRQPGGRPTSDTAFEICPHFDARFDEFWKELQNQNQTRLLAVRNRSALEWHFRATGRRDDVRILAAAKQNRLVAYAVFDRQDNPELGLRRMRLVDFQAFSGYEELLRPALAWMLRYGRGQRIHVVENAGCWLDRLRVPGTGAWYRRRLRCWLFYYLTYNRELGDELRQPETWMPSLFDGDSSI